MELVIKIGGWSGYYLSETWAVFGEFCFEYFWGVSEINTEDANVFFGTSGVGIKEYITAMR